MGNMRGLDGLYDRYAPPLFLRILRNQKKMETAEETLVNVFTRFCQKIEEFDNNNNAVLPWLIKLSKEVAPVREKHINKVIPLFKELKNPKLKFLRK